MRIKFASEWKGTENSGWDFGLTLGLELGDEDEM